MLFLNCCETWAQDGDSHGTSGPGQYTVGFIRPHLPGYTNDYVTDWDAKSWDSALGTLGTGIPNWGMFDLIDDDRCPINI